MLPLTTILDHLEKFAPTRFAADWDNVGLLLGERSSQVSRLMTCLTVTPTTADEAIDAQGRADRHPPPHPLPAGEAAHGRHRRGADAAGAGPRRGRRLQPAHGFRQRHRRHQRPARPQARPRRGPPAALPEVRRREAGLPARRLRPRGRTVARQRRPLRGRRGQDRRVHRMQLPRRGHRHVPRLRQEQPDRRRKGAARGGRRVPPRDGLPRCTPARGHRRAAQSALLRGTGVRPLRR